VQVAYATILCTHLALMMLSGLLILGVYQERCSLLTPWVMGIITFMALEGVCCVYSNVLRDHINKRFDGVCKAEMCFFVLRILFNILAIYGVLRLYRNLRDGWSYRDPETIQL
ncbi:unnamed protein product, partial [Meganyctiphanes norvegica]